MYAYGAGKMKDVSKKITPINSALFLGGAGTLLVPSLPTHPPRHPGSAFWPKNRKSCARAPRQRKATLGVDLPLKKKPVWGHLAMGRHCAQTKPNETKQERERERER